MMYMEDKTQIIAHGMELYFRTFALSDTMHLQAEDIEWVSPQPSAAGPSIVFKVNLDERTARVRLEALMPEIQAGVIPSLWAIAPTSTPATIVDDLLSVGFKGGADAAHPEPGMALDMDAFHIPAGAHPTGLNSDIIQVKSVAEFASWIHVVNEALHGWNMLNIEHYQVWLQHAPYTFYLACHHGTPIATLATLWDGETASVEFVSTLQQHRRQGAATALCIQALLDLRSKGVKTVTLRSSTEAIPLYTRLGFRPYYELLIFSYPSG